jgi:hypothetical protein
MHVHAVPRTLLQNQMTTTVTACAIRHMHALLVKACRAISFKLHSL